MRVLRAVHKKIVSAVPAKEKKKDQIGNDAVSCGHGLWISAEEHLVSVFNMWVKNTLTSITSSGLKCNANP